MHYLPFGELRLIADYMSGLLHAAILLALVGLGWIFLDLFLFSHSM